MEGQLLPRAELRPAYGKAVWLYVYRDFSKGPEDLAAERVCLRLGMSAYPQHLLVHPETMEVLADTGRAVDGFLAAMDRVRVAPARSVEAADRIRLADERAAALEKSGSVPEARKALEDPDLVVRIRALEVLVAKAPEAVAPKAAALLEVPNDPLRFLACEALRKAGTPEAARPLEALVREPGASLNPNVLRIRAVEALATCGDADSVEVIRPHAASGEYRNGLTRTSVDALGAIATRVEKARPAVRDTLAASYPRPASGDAEARMCLGLAKAVHAALEKLTGRRVPFPDPYDAAAREKLSKAWK